MARLRLFTYHVILDPEDAEKGEKQKDSKLIIEPTTVLAKDSKSLAFKVSREIPEKYVEYFDRIEIGIAPFNERTKKETDLSSKISGLLKASTKASEDILFNPNYGTTQFGSGDVLSTLTSASAGNYFNASQVSADANI